MIRQILVFATQMTATGGIENHLVRFCERLAAIGADITFLCPDFRPSPELDRKLRQTCRRMIVLPAHNGRTHAISKSFWLFLAVLQLQHRSFDCLYLNGKGALSFWVWKACGWRAQRSVVHHHNSGEPDDVDTWPNAYYKLLGGATSVVACSSSNASSMVKILRRRVRVIYCFSEPCNPRSVRGVSSRFSFGLIGRLIPEKGVDTILRLSLEPDLADIHWHLWGPLDGYPIGFTKTYPNVTLHPPFHSRDSLEQAMARLDAFTLFSTHPEGLPLTLLEAMSAGVPWIATDRGGIRDLVINPIDTILLPQSFTYADAFIATKTLALSLRQGLTTPEYLVQAYRARFHPDALILQWKDLLFSGMQEI
jgi:glycosyltransferase involved in cell wall biosynthesis